MVIAVTIQLDLKSLRLRALLLSAALMIQSRMYPQRLYVAMQQLQLLMAVDVGLALSPALPRCGEGLVVRVAPRVRTTTCLHLELLQQQLIMRRVWTRRC